MFREDGTLAIIDFGLANWLNRCRAWIPLLQQSFKFWPVGKSTHEQDTLMDFEN